MGQSAGKPVTDVPHPPSEEQPAAAPVKSLPDSVESESEIPTAAVVPRRFSGWLRPRNVILAVLGLAAAIWMGHWGYLRLTHLYIFDARVAADVISISSRVEGWVTSMPVIEGDRIRKGDLLVTIDNRESLSRVEELTAAVAALEAQKVRLKVQQAFIGRRIQSRMQAARFRLEAAKAARGTAEFDQALALKDFQRSKTLLSESIISRQEWEREQTAYQKARQSLQQAKADVATFAAQLSEVEAEQDELQVIQSQILVLGHQADQMTARQNRQTMDLQDRTILAPYDGLVDRTFASVGEFVSGGQRLLMIHDPSRIWIKANVKETNIRHVQVGDKAIISVDAYPGRTFTGTVVRMGQAATSQFALLPNPNPSGNFTKITQRLPIRIAIEQDNELLRPGMMVEVDIEIGGS